MTLLIGFLECSFPTGANNAYIIRTRRKSSAELGGIVVYLAFIDISTQYAEEDVIAGVVIENGEFGYGGDGGRYFENHRQEDCIARWGDACFFSS